jgi:hypothetical protein
VFRLEDLLMPTYVVTFHAEGWAEIEVDADDPRDALDRAYDRVDQAETEWVHDVVEEVAP